MQIIKPIYHILFWIFVFFFGFDLLIYGYDLLPAVGLSFVEVAIHAIIFYFNLHILIPRILVPKGSKIYIIGLVVFLIAILLPYFYSGLGHYLIDENELRIILSFSINYILFTLISLLYWYLTMYQHEKHYRLALQNEKLQAELLFLKSQVSPHFLFNSLNNIYSLSVIKHDNAPVMIEKLSDILRYVIYEGNKQEVLLEREIELINNYIELQLLKKLKAEKNIAISVNGLRNSQKIAPLILINIVENCFKHSDLAYNSDGFLKLQVLIQNNLLKFSAANSFQQSGKNTGIGLENIKKQLHYYYPKLHHVDILNSNGIFKVALQIELSS
jgi:sensor histidine kinase YesM